MENFRKLQVWQKAHTLVLNMYITTQAYPNTEKFGLTSQIRRSAVSIPANIAEGSKRKSNKHKIHYNTIAEGSLEEIKYYILLSYNLNYITKEKGIYLMEIAREVGKLLAGYTKYIRKQ